MYTFMEEFKLLSCLSRELGRLTVLITDAEGKERVKMVKQLEALATCRDDCQRRMTVMTAEYNSRRQALTLASRKIGDT